MPLILMCGFPCSGKSRRAKELKEHFEHNSDRKVYIVGDESLGEDKNAVYADSQEEKRVRAALKAEAERKLNKEDIVILDSFNYIKGKLFQSRGALTEKALSPLDLSLVKSSAGYRYELFCVIKHLQTTHCLVYCLTSGDVSSAWNSSRDTSEQFTQEIFDALVLRFEAPDSRNRWDSPLFTVLQDDPLPFDVISDALLKRKAPPPNQSTQTQSLSSANFLYELDKMTQDVLTAIFNAQKTSVPGDLVTVPGATEKIELTRNINMAELRKLRRQFISYTKLNPTENTGQIANMFVQYLNKSLP